MEAVQNLLSTRRGAVFVGGCAALLAAILLVVYLHRYRSSLRASSAPASVLVARNLIPKGAPGDVLSSTGQVEVTTLPRDQLENGALTDLSSLRGRVALDDIYPGEQVTASQFSLTPTTALRNRLAGVQRGIAVSTDVVHGLIGDIQAGDRIDIWADVGTKSGASTTPTLRLVLGNVYVLRPSLSSGGSYILRADQRDAARLAWAYNNSKLYFMLRPPTGARTQVTTVSGLFRARGR